MGGRGRGRGAAQKSGLECLEGAKCKESRKGNARLPSPLCAPLQLA